MNAPDPLRARTHGIAPAPAPGADAADPGPGAPPRLLLVDDDAMLRMMAARTLRHVGFDVVDSADGEAALAQFKAQPFDLVLLDVVMPGLDGYEVCRRLRQLPRGARVPVLMLTGLNDTASIELAYGCGATDFITKPINWTLLSHRVRYALRAAASAETLRHGREQLARAQRLAAMGSWAFTADGRVACSPELARLYGGGSADGQTWHATPEALLACVLPDDQAAVALARRRLRDEGCAYQLEYRIERLDGQTRTLHEQAMPLLDDAGRRIGVEGITQDITERVQAELRIRQLAHYDSVTGLPNQQFFAELAAPALDRARRLGLHCAVLHVDLDHFKAVNDAFGRQGGDQVLQALAERLRGWIRGTDLASGPAPANSLAATAAAADSDAAAEPNDRVVARVGGNAFTLLVADLAGQASAATVAQRLLKAVLQPLTLNTEDGAPASLVLSACIGIALYPGDAPDLAGLTRCAEQAAYAAKARGRGELRFFDETIDAQAARRLRVETELRRAIADGELRLHFQPKVSVEAETGGTCIAGAEALVRWQHPERGLVPPGEFVPLAEETGLIGPLTDWVLAEACRQLRQWQDQGLGSLTLAVNLAAPSFADPTLDSRLLDLVSRHGLQPEQLVLEVTESLLMHDPEATAARLAALRVLGFGLALDDFGTGYSSLSYLKRFAIDELKIDRSFVIDAARGGRDSALAKSIIALGRDLGLRVVAEGVETPEQAAFLRRHGCLWHQGWLYAKALPGAAFAELLRSGARLGPAG